MKYYSEEVVKKIITDAMRYGMDISQCVPMSADSYPSIELPDNYGALIDRDKLLLALVIINSLDDEAKDLFLEAVQNAPVILEATE